jgi:hypothetical protein
VEEAIIGLVVDGYLLVVLAEDIWGWLFQIFQSLHRAQVLALKTSSLDHYLSQSSQFFGTHFEDEAQSPF